MHAPSSPLISISCASYARFQRPGIVCTFARHLNCRNCLSGCVQSVAMLRSITSFHNLATQAVERTASGGTEGHKITFNVIKQRLGDVLYKITSQKFEDPADGEEAVKYASLSTLTLCKASFPPTPFFLRLLSGPDLPLPPVLSKLSLQKRKHMSALLAHPDEWHIHALLVHMYVTYLLLSSN